MTDARNIGEGATTDIKEILRGEGLLVQETTERYEGGKGKGEKGEGDKRRERDPLTALAWKVG